MARVNLSVVLPTSRKLSDTLPAIVSVARALSTGDELLIVANGPISATYSSHLFSCREIDTRATINLICEDCLGLLAGRHRGVLDAASDYLTFIDDDILVEKTWASGIRERFEDPTVHLVGGPSRPQPGIRFPEWMTGLWQEARPAGQYFGYLSLLDCGNDSFDVSPSFVWGLNFSIRKDSLLKVGGFHPDGVPWELRRFRGDGETAVSVEIEKRGWRAVYEPRAAVTHVVPPERLTIEYLERRSHLQGISDSYTQIRKHGLPAAIRQKSSSPSARQFFRRIRDRLRGLSATNARIPTLRPAEFSDTERLAAAYKGGFEYHQHCVRNDPALLEWVMRENYWDYSYPEPISR